MPQSVSIPQLLERSAMTALEDVHTCLPCKVVRYNAARQTVDVKPCVREPVVDADGATEFVDLPDLLDVPVAFQSAGGYALTFPIAAGDFALVLFSEVDAGTWRVRGDTPSNPGPTRRHGLGSAFAIIGVRPTSGPLATHPTDRLTLGKDGADARIEITAGSINLGASASDFVALASKVDSAVSTIVSAFNSHTHSVAAAPGTSAPPTAPISPAPPGVGSALVKVQP